MVLSSLAGAQVRISEPKENTVSHFRYQFVSGTAPAGAAVKLSINGRSRDSSTVRPDGVFEFLGVDTPEGPVTYTVTVRMANGQKYSAERKMHRVGPPDSIAVTTNAAVPADGKSIVKFTVRVLDKWGAVIPDGYFVTSAADSIQYLGADADLKTPGIQVPLANGLAEYTVKAPRQAGPYDIMFSVNGMKTVSTIEFTTPVEPMILVGSADASGNWLTTSGDLSAIKNETKVNEGFHHDGRLAFYGRGSIWSDYLLTASYDNTRRQDRLFKEVDPDVLYSLYGDNSTIDYTAQSNNPFFVKLERGRSYALFGDYNTALSHNELARYDRTFNGVKAHFESKKESADIFATLTDRKVVQDEIRGQGISGYYFLGKSNIVIGTEKVRIETRDKLHNEIIISRLEKTRIGDYDIDYQQGTLFFKQPVAGIDANGNPVYIVVSYEAEAAGAAEYSYVVGAQAQKEILGGWRLGATAVHDRSNNNFTLLGADTKVDLGRRLAIGGEFAHGFDKTTAGGNAWKVDLTTTPIDKLQLKSYYRSVDAGFMNQTMGAGGVSNEAGSTKYGAGAAYTGLAATKLAAEFYKSTQLSNNQQVVINSVTGSAEHAFGNVATLGAKVEKISYDMPGDTASGAGEKQSTIIGVKGTVKPTERLNIIGEYEHSISSSAANEVKPSVASIGAEYKVFDPVTIAVSEKFYGNGGNVSLFGITSDIGYGTSAQARYQLGSGMSGQRNQVSIGLKNILHVTESFTTNISFERTRALDRNIVEAATEDNDAVSLGLEFLPKSPYKATIKGELAKNSQGIRRIVSFGGDMRLAGDFTLIDKFTYYEEARTEPQSASASAAEGTLSTGQVGTALGAGLMKKVNNIVGLAYRPSSFDWLNAIGKYEKKMEFNGVVAPQTSFDVDIVSVHAFVEPVIGLEIGAKYAMKHDDESAFGLSASTMTDFYLVRADYDLRWSHLDVAAEYRLLASRIIGQENSSSSNNGYSAELGYVLLKNIHVGVGYNFVGTKDRDLVSQEYWSSGPFITVRAKFTEKIFDMFHSN
jgi:hypothetical protein